MRMYDNETKIYPDFNPTAPQEPQSYRLNKLSEIEAYFLNVIEVREQIAKTMKRFNTITGILDTGLITSTVITGGISIAAFASGVGLPVGIALGGTSLLLSLATAITRIFTVKQEKHNAVLAQSKLDGIANIISQAMQDGDISPTEFHKVLKYRKLKADIRNQAKAKIKEITKEQRVELLEQGRKEGKEDFLRKISNTSGTQGVNAIYNMNLLHPTPCDFIVHKAYKNWPKIYVSSMLNQCQDSTPHLSSYQSLYHHPSLYFFEVPPMRVSSLYLPSAFDHILFGQ